MPNRLKVPLYGNLKALARDKMSLEGKSTVDYISVESLKWKDIIVI